MSNKIILKKSSVVAKVPLTSDLEYGELALNYADGKLYFKNSSNAINSFSANIDLSAYATLTGTQTLTNKTLTSPAISSPTITGNVIATGAINTIGDLANTAPFNGNATRSLNLIGNSAVMRVARTTTTGNPAVELLGLDPTTGGILDWWDFYSGSDIFNIRRRTGGAADILLQASSSGVNFPTGTLSVGSVLVPTISSTSTLTNKTLTSPNLTGTVGVTATTLLAINGNTGNNGQFLARGPTGLTWTGAPTASLVTLSDVSISNAQPQQVLTYTGSAWINADSNAVVASAVFATSQADLGFVYDSVVNIQENLGSVTEIAYSIYDLGVLSFTGIISLNNIDQSVKSDYIGYSIIFGF